MTRGEYEFDSARAMEATRPLVVAAMVKRLQGLEEHLDSWDAECDRALSEMWWLTRWIEGRVSRNETA